MRIGVGRGVTCKKAGAGRKESCKDFVYVEVRAVEGTFALLYVLEIEST